MSPRNQAIALRRADDSGALVRRHNSGRRAGRRRGGLRVNTSGEANEYERQQQHEAHAKSLPRRDAHYK